MPRRDGTGPSGKGAGTGRRRGNVFSLHNKEGKFSVWRSLVVPAIGFIVNDARKPDGITQKTIHSIANRLSNKKLADSKKTEVKNAEYEIVEDDRKGE
ncbi:MAG: DUF5320 domain-containing protein [Candidatus Cloacimonadota bacterium]|nr:DUF5320 domain-containing protein [Candidatus Cloacimonadota bacterium]